jgi:hypothetical protein
MKRKILIGFGIVVVLIVVGMLYMNNRNRTLSPSGSTEIENQGLEVRVDYSRPSVRGRKIFGNETDNLLLPYGKYWRLGANEPTLITVNKDFKFNGIAMPAGQYDMYAIPAHEFFEIRLNTGLRFWGATEPDYDEDVLNTKVPATIINTNVEQFTISATASGPDIILQMMWADREWSVTISPN